MVANNTSFCDLDTFDGTLTDEDIQRFNTHVKRAAPTEGVTDPSTFEKALLNKNVITDKEHITYRMRLVIEKNSPTNEHSLCEYVAPIAYGSVSVDPFSDTAYVGHVAVLDPFQEYGIGTQVKRYLLNHAEQQDVDVIYTWISSDEGEGLARKTGFTEETTVFTDNPIFKKEIT